MELKKTATLKDKQKQGIWVAQLRFWLRSRSHVWEMEPHIRFCADSAEAAWDFCLCLSLSPATYPSPKYTTLKKEKQKHNRLYFPTTLTITLHLTCFSAVTLPLPHQEMEFPSPPPRFWLGPAAVLTNRLW